VKRSVWFLMILSLVGVAFGAPQLMNYQGILKDRSTGDPINDPSAELVFRIYNAETGGDLVFEEQLTGVEVTDGLFSVQLGTINGANLEYALIKYDALWLQIGIGILPHPEWLAPRQRLTSAGYAIQTSFSWLAEDADTVDGMEAADLDQSAHVGDTGNPHSVTYDQVGAAAENHNHSASNITSGTLNDARIPAGITRDSEFATLDYGRSGVASNLYEGSTALTNKYVELDGDVMTGSLESIYTGTNDFAMKGVGSNGPTDGYLGVQGLDNFQGVASADWDGLEIGVAGISTGSTTADNVGVLGHGNDAGVRGEDADNPAIYGELGAGSYGAYGTGTYGVRGEGSSYGIYGTGGNRGVYGISSNTTGTVYGVYGSATGSSGTNYGVYGTSDDYGVRGSGDTYGIYGSSDGTSGTIAGVYGYATSSTGNNYGVYGNGATAGVYGYTGSSNTTGMGVYARGYGQGLNYPALCARSVDALGIALHAHNDSASSSDATIVLSNDGDGALLKGFGGNGGNEEISIRNDGKVDLYNDEHTLTVEIEPAEAGSSGEGGQITMSNSAGVDVIWIDGDHTYDQGHIEMKDSSGTTTIRLDADYAGTGDGRISTQELSITGGSDLSEQFDIRTASDGTEALPGMVVSIDPSHPGELVVSTEPYDRKVAGIVSGANGVEPGMMMGQEGSVANGDTAVALTGRVYCWADASSGPIVPGDLLTSSDVPGYAMKVADHNAAIGATIGKAMTSLQSGRGLVLVLVSLQ